VLQLVMATLVAVLVFAERPTALQWSGIALGIVAVALIVWPQGGQG
jgi:drug/metabolite transporter (DMT)-like permease